MLLNPSQASYDHFDPRTREIMLKTITFFESMGKARLKKDYHEMAWYSDFITFVKENKVFATLLTPSQYADGDADTRWDTFRICAFNEILGFYGLPYWYAWQVTILGLGPIWMSGNDAAKQKAARLLREGHIFAFGLSERTHGADLYASDMSLTPLGEGRYVADGGKYYIGNGNQAAMVSTFGKDSETGDYVFFSVDSRDDHYECKQNVVAWQGYVAEYALNAYPLSEDDILSTGPDAWDAALNTVNVGKFNLGWGAIGICSHAFFEAITHAAHRNLYGKWVTDFPHIQQLFTDAYTRLAAMKIFASRAIDYMRTASAEDRRYLLYNPLVKMKVTTQGETVINLLWDVIAAKGFEKDTYFEMAAREIRSLPKLEGTVHVNMALVVKFMANYFFNPAPFPQIPRREDAADDTFLFQQGPTKGLGKIQFHDYKLVYDSVSLPNVDIFKAQIRLLVELLATATPTDAQRRDIDFLLSLGELFTLVVYGQLIIEKAGMDQMAPDLLDQIFDFMVRDFSAFALQLYSKCSSTEGQMALCLKMIQRPAVDNDRFQRVWREAVLPLKDAYAMNP
jgi:acyl-CoA dehydrogenase